MRNEKVICKIRCHPCTGSGQESTFTPQSIRCQVAVGRCHGKDGWSPCGNVSVEHHNTGNSRVPRAGWEGEIKIAVLPGKKERREGESFASSSFLFSYQNSSSSSLVLFEGKVQLSRTHSETLCRNQVPCSGITPHQLAAASPSNCFPEL